MSKILLIETSIGSLSFNDLTEGAVKKFFVSVQRCLDAFREKGFGNSNCSTKIVLSS